MPFETSKPKKIFDKINKEIHIPNWPKATNENIITYNEELSNSNIDEIHTILVNAINKSKNKWLQDVLKMEK
jgi:hypothetical protein